MLSQFKNYLSHKGNNNNRQQQQNLTSTQINLQCTTLYIPNINEENPRQNL